MRARDLGIEIGRFSTGKYNAITDVQGVFVGHKTVIRDTPRVARTGVTMIIPRSYTIWEDYAFAGYHSFNGNGEMTGIHWLKESGMLGSPIAITNTHQVGVVRDALIMYSTEKGYPERFLLPVVAETYDGWLSDIDAFHLTVADALEALETAHNREVEEGNVGGGTGMICHDFKGGIGTSSRVVEMELGEYTVGVLVQANYGDRHQLRIDGVPIGRFIGNDKAPIPFPAPNPTSSIIAVIATDAPLLPVQCNRLAQRATVGLARVGGAGYNGSGDIFIAFSTGNSLPAQATAFLQDIQMLPHKQMNDLFDAVADATEEAILNALCAAETMTGFQGRTAYKMPLDEVARILALYREAEERALA